MVLLRRVLRCLYANHDNNRNGMQDSWLLRSAKSFHTYSRVSSVATTTCQKLWQGLDHRMINRQSIVLSLFFVLASTIGLAQAAFFPVEYTTFRHPAPGYYLLAPNSIDSIGFIDHGAATAHAVRSRLPVSMFLQHDNTLTYIDTDRAFYKMNTALKVIDTLRINGYEIDFHECRTLANGNTVLFAFDTRTIDMSTLVSGGKPNAKVTGALLREITPSGAVVFEWSTFDHTNILDAVDAIDLTTATIDYAHPNSICEDVDGNFLLSVRHFDAVLKINRNSGEIMWWLGGEKAKRNDFTWTNDDIDGFTGFSHQHSVEVMSNGNILMFDNGNLRTNRFSRAVMYQLDEVNMTVTKVWEFRHTPDIYASSMGSVQELPNGNIVIGWGTNSTHVVATEVAPDGSVEAELATPLPEQIRSYRVYKAPFSMTGVQKNVTAAGSHVMESDDSTSHLTLMLQSASSPTNVIVERHWNTVRSPVLQQANACRLLPARWSVRTDKTNTLTGTMRFDVGSVPGIDAPSYVVLFHRATEGTGAFTKVTATYDTASATLSTQAFKTGEYIAAYETCLIPYPVLPVDKATHLRSDDITFTWSEAVQTDGYQLQVSTGAGFATTVLDVTVQDAQAYTSRIFGSYTLYYWRVRARLGNNQYGQWSEVRTFRTRLNTPGPIAPRVDVDTISVLTSTPLTWNGVGNAKSYHVRLFRKGQQDSLVEQDTVMTPGWTHGILLPNTWYAWDVRALSDTASSDISNRVSFLTSPEAPRLLSPDDSTQNLGFINARFSWSEVDSARAYRLRITSGSNDSVSVDTIVDKTVFIIDALKPETRFRWSVVALGRYGVGRWAAERTFWTAAVGTLASASLLSPVQDAIVRLDSVVLTWDQQRASSWMVEVGTSAAMGTIVHSATELTTPTYLLPTSFLEEGRSYHWRVKGSNNTQESSFSAVRRFTVAVAPPPPIIGLKPLSPADASVDVLREGEFRWTSDSRMTEYQVAIFRGASVFPLRTYNTTDTVVSYAGLDYETEYTWHVRGRVKGVIIDTGDVATFTTEKKPTTSTVQFEETPLGSNTLRGTVGCGVQRVTIICTDFQGRLLEQVDVPVNNGMWSYVPAQSGLTFISVSACGVRSSRVVWVP